MKTQNIVLRDDMEREEVHQVDHYQQRYHWDCGLSCCLMVMNKTDRDFILTNLNKFVEEEGFGESTWTIDLCYVLKRFNIEFIYTTITIGVDPGYCKEAFYDKVIAKDNDRVNERFDKATELKMTIEEKSVSLEDILNHLKTRGPVIVLTNANILSCSKCSNYTSWFPSCWTGAPSYQGHYILLVGFNNRSSEVLYRNPTLRDKICYMSYQKLEETRTCYGTDEDIIFICP